MAQGKNKPDLSDLKARLGLKKQGAAKNEQQQESAQPQAAPSSQGQPSQAAADGPGPSAGPAQRGPVPGGPAQAGPPGGGPPPGASGPPPGAAGPPRGAQGPPAGAQRPPNGASASPSGSPASSAQQASSAQPSGPSAQSQRRQSAGNDTSAGAQTSSGSSADIALDAEDLKAAGGSAFSPATVILMVVLLIVGVVFGWMAAGSMQNREVYNARSEDAARIHEALQANVANLDEAKNLIGKLSANPSEADYKLNEQLAALEIAPSGNVLGGNRLLLGPEIIDSVTTYMTDARILERMLDEHQKQTNNDKDELKELVEGNEVVKKDQFAVLFDVNHLFEKGRNDEFTPRKGRLVTVPSLEKDEEGKIEVELLNSDRTVKTRIQGLVPLGKDDILKSGGQNALSRYQTRIKNINHHLLKFQQYRGGMMSKLEELASQDSAPLFNF